MPVFKESIGATRDWLKNRFEALGFDDETDEIVYKSNDYYDDGLGIQSVQVIVERDGKELLLEDEVKSPTIGIIARDLLEAEERELVNMDFGISDEEAEEVTLMSKEGLRLGKTKKGTDLSSVPLSFRKKSAINGSRENSCHACHTRGSQRNGRRYARDRNGFL